MQTFRQRDYLWQTYLTQSDRWSIKRLDRREKDVIKLLSIQFVRRAASLFQFY